jgi:hypothetical protein
LTSETSFCYNTLMSLYEIIERKGLEKKVTVSRNTRLLRWAVATGLVVTSLLLATGSASAAEEIPLLDIKTKCVDASSPYGQPNYLLPPRIQVSIDGAIKRSSGSNRLVPYKPQHVAPADIVYMFVEDHNGGRQYVVTSTSVESTSIGATLEGYLSGRSRQIIPNQTNLDEAQKRYIKPLSNYTVTVGTAAYNEDRFPQSRETLARGAFSVSCSISEGGQQLPLWALPKALQSLHESYFPLPNSSGEALPKQY